MNEFDIHFQKQVCMCKMHLHVYVRIVVHKQAYLTCLFESKFKKKRETCALCIVLRLLIEFGCLYSSSLTVLCRYL